MTLNEIAAGYRDAAVPLRKRLKELRTALNATDDPEEIWHLKRRIAELTPMLTECNALADLCEHYYERGYYRNEKYVFQQRLPGTPIVQRYSAAKSKKSSRERTDTQTEGDF